MRKIPEQKEFQSLMWQTMADDEEWMKAMDDAIEKLPPGDPWPTEEGK